MGRIMGWTRRLATAAMTMTLVLGAVAGTPAVALADVTIARDGLDKVGVTEWRIDGAKLSKANVEYHLGSDWGKMTRADGSDVLYVTMGDSSIGKTGTWHGINVIFKDAAYKQDGTRRDVVLSLVPTVKIGCRQDGVTDQHGDLKIVIMRLEDQTGALPWLDSYIMDPATGESTASVDPRVPGSSVRCTVRIGRFVDDGEFWVGEDGTLDMYFEDLDMPDKTTPALAYDGPYSESVTLERSFSGTIHTRPDTTLVVASDGKTVRGTEETFPGGQARSAFTTLCSFTETESIDFTWHGSVAGTQLFKSWDFDQPGYIRLVKVTR